MYFPQKSIQPESLPRVQSGSIAGSTGANIPEKPGKEPKKGIWPFRKKVENKPEMRKKPLTDAEITQVGAKDPPAYPDPLLRLMMPITTEQGIVPAGIYLVRQLDKTEQSRTLALTRQHQIVTQFTVSAAPSSDQSPIQPVDRHAPPRLSIEAQQSVDHRTVKIFLKEGIRVYESLAFPIALDRRKILTY